MPLHQLFLVTLVGVTSGVYIYRPLFERYANERGLKHKQNEGSAKPVAATGVVDEVKSPAPTQKQENVSSEQQKESVENTPVGKDV